MKKIINEGHIRNIVRCVLKEYLYGSDSCGSTSYEGVYNFYPYEVEFNEEYELESEDFCDILSKFNIKDCYKLEFSVTEDYDNSVGYHGSDNFNMNYDDGLFEDIKRLLENGYEKYYEIIKGEAESIQEEDIEWRECEPYYDYD